MWITTLYLLFNHNIALSSFSCILHRNLYLIVALLLPDITLLKDRSSSKDISQIYIWHIILKVGWSLKVKFLKNATDATLCYPRYKLLKACDWKIILTEIKNLERWCLLADYFCKHFDWTFFVVVPTTTAITSILFFWEPWSILAKVKILYTAYWGVKNGLHNNITCIPILKIFIRTEFFKIKMC